MFRIETDRLVMRPVHDSDAEATALLMTADISSNLSSWPYPLSIEEARERTRRSTRMLEERTGIDCAITDKSNGQLMGWIGQVVISADTAALGYWLGEDFRGKGFAREAVRAFLPEGAAILGVEDVEAYTSESNARSIAVLEDNGFEFRGIETLFVQIRGRDEQLMKYARTLVSAEGSPVRAERDD